MHLSIIQFPLIICDNVKLSRKALTLAYFVIICSFLHIRVSPSQFDKKQKVTELSLLSTYVLVIRFAKRFSCADLKY